MTQFTTYLTFDAGVGLIRPIRAAGEFIKGDYIAIYGANGDPIAYVGMNDDADHLVVGSKVGGEWMDIQRLPIREVSGDTAITFTPIGEKAVDIELPAGNTVRFRTRAPLFSACTLAGSGDWNIEQLPSADVNKQSDVSAPVTDLEDFPVLGPRPSAELIYDFGMHVATDTEFYLKKGFRVVAIEANPILAEAAARRLNKWIRAGRLVILNIGVAPVAGAFPFYVNKVHSEWSSFDKAIASRGHEVERIEVRTAPPQDIFAIFGAPYFIKIDIEGYDGLVVGAAVELPQPPRYLSFENGDLAIFEILVGAGYDGFKLINQRTVSELNSAAPALEGIAVEHSFPFGSSGPFGKETPGTWTSADETRAFLIEHFEARAERRGPDVDWWDLHAKHGSAG
jgi:FkbM family methyltransferase